MREVIVVGSATLDQFYTLTSSLTAVNPGDKLLASSHEVHIGGGATNAAVCLKGLGVNVALLTKLGSDHKAQFIQDALKLQGIPNLCKKRSKQCTDTAVVLNTKGQKDRTIIVHKGASSDLNIDDCPNRTKTKWVYLASLHGHALETAHCLVSKTKAKVLFNPSQYLAKQGKVKLAPLLKQTDLLILNKQEAQLLLKTRTKDPHKLLKKLQACGPKEVVITNGAHACYAFLEEEFLCFTPPRVPIVHTAGAGDAFSATLLAAKLKGFTPKACLELAQANASSVIGHVGTKNGLLSLTKAKNYAKKLKIKVK